MEIELIKEQFVYIDEGNYSFFKQSLESLRQFLTTSQLVLSEMGICVSGYTRVGNQIVYAQLKSNGKQLFTKHNVATMYAFEMSRSGLSTLVHKTRTDCIFNIGSYTCVIEHNDAPVSLPSVYYSSLLKPLTAECCIDLTVTAANKILKLLTKCSLVDSLWIKADSTSITFETGTDCIIIKDKEHVCSKNAFEVLMSKAKLKKRKISGCSSNSTEIVIPFCGSPSIDYCISIGSAAFKKALNACKNKIYLPRLSLNQHGVILSPVPKNPSSTLIDSCIFISKQRSAAVEEDNVEVNSLSPFKKCKVI